MKATAGASAATISLESDRMLLNPSNKFVELLVERKGSQAAACWVNWRVVKLPNGEPLLQGTLNFDKYQESKFVRLQRGALPPNSGVAVLLAETSPNCLLGLVPATVAFHAAARPVVERRVARARPVVVAEGENASPKDPLEGITSMLVMPKSLQIPTRKIHVPSSHDEVSKSTHKSSTNLNMVWGPRNSLENYNWSPKRSQGDPESPQGELPAPTSE